jgi:hypothetical protein
MRTLLTAVFLVSVLVVDANANTGIFFGSGHTITLGKSEQVQLVSEDVTIRPRCGWKPIMDSVDYHCKFVLKNLTAKPVTIQVGFPLDSQFVQQAKAAPNAIDLVTDYHFIACDSRTTYRIRFVPHDLAKKFSRLFVWDMAFDPAETKVLHVAYQIGMSQAGGRTRKEVTIEKASAPYCKPWHGALESCYAEFFHYVTETGKSWAGPIEKATFRVQTGAWERCLGERLLTDAEPPEPKPQQEWWDYEFPLKAGAIYQIISPEGWKYEHWENNPAEDARTWEYKNYKPGEPLSLIYYVVAIPRAAADCDSWVRHVLGSTPRREDLEELREIAAAFYGIAPRSPSAAKFVEQQVWYHPKKGLRESELKGEQQALLKRLDAITQKRGR